MEEIWKEYPEFKDIISVSNLGRVKTEDRIVKQGKGFSLKKGQLLSQSIDSSGYSSISFSFSGKTITRRVHRILMLSFEQISGCEGLEVNHKDGNKQNNTLLNLEWMTKQENMQHAIENGLIPTSKDYFVQSGRKISYKGNSNCKHCNKIFKKKEYKQIYCSPTCAHLSVIRTTIPEQHELYNMLSKEKSFTKVAAKYGVTYTAVKKWCDKYNMPRLISHYKSL